MKKKSETELSVKTAKKGKRRESEVAEKGNGTSRVPTTSFIHFLIHHPKDIHEHIHPLEDDILEEGPALAESRH